MTALEDSAAPDEVGPLDAAAAERAPGAFDHDRVAAAVREILIGIGEDPDRDGLRDTPQRVARAYAEMFQGIGQEPESVLATVFDLGHDEFVLVKDIEVWSCCEHHLVPFTGVAHVGYIPSRDGRITGLSKLARLVDLYAKRPQVQERLTTQIADALNAHPRTSRGDRGDRVRAPVHDHARSAQARVEDHHQRRTGSATQRRDPRRGHGTHHELNRLGTSARSNPAPRKTPGNHRFGATRSGASWRFPLVGRGAGG